MKRLNAKTKVQTSSVLDILFADDVCLGADTAEKLQEAITRLNDSCNRFGLKVNYNKTEVMRQTLRNADQERRLPLNIRVELNQVFRFKYLGSTISCDTKIDAEMSTRIARAAMTFGKLTLKVFRSHDLSAATKIKVYSAVIVNILIYGIETWCLYRRHIKKLDQFAV